ncbi:hypothetical protein BXT92_16135 [Klebsiella pneumoniae]|nr:hypothetical protein BXT92_16135 [Klebsiella pneumoniae]
MAAFFARADDSLAEESAHFLSFLLNLFPKSQILWRLMADLSFREWRVRDVCPKNYFYRRRFDGVRQKYSR